MIKTTAQKIYLGLIFIFLYAPIITLIVLSFNASKTRAKWGGFTTKWYAALFRNEQIMQALWNTLAHAIHETYQPCYPWRNHKYSNAECGNRYRYLPDASVPQLWYKVWLRDHSACTHYL